MVAEQMSLTVGQVHPSRNPVTSNIEKDVRAALVAAGYPVRGRRLAVVCRDPEDDTQTVSLTPDIALVEHMLAVEVDPCGPSGGRYSSHAGQEQKDRVRNAMFADAGWTVLRLRLGATRGGHIGSRDVVVESSGLTVAAKAALLEALDDAVHHRRAKVRVVKKGKSPAPAQRRSTITNIGANKYTDDGFFFGWFPDLTGAKITMRLACGGRFIYTNDRDMLFVAEIRLHEIPADQWKPRLQEVLATLDPASVGTTKWPWGDTLLTCDTNDQSALDVVESCERKASIDEPAFRFTTNCDPLTRWVEVSLLTENHLPIATLHPEAVRLGYRVVELKTHSGRYGLYQSIVIGRG